MKIAVDMIDHMLEEPFETYLDHSILEFERSVGQELLGLDSEENALTQHTLH